jgi:hypothetical protein
LQTSPKQESLVSNSTPHFQYQGLPQGRYFRLLRLLPGKYDNKVACELIVTGIDEAHPYEPISYAWGEQTNRRQILCDGKILSITASLYGALRQFRHEQEARILWADGVCIDQSNLAERAHQVGLMESVYKNGVCTLVWLGESREEDRVQDTFQRIRELNCAMMLDQKILEEIEERGVLDRLSDLGVIKRLL